MELKFLHISERDFLPKKDTLFSERNHHYTGIQGKNTFTSMKFAHGTRQQLIIFREILAFSVVSTEFGQ